MFKFFFSRRKAVSWVCLAVMVTVIFAGCSEGPQQTKSEQADKTSNEPVTISLMTRFGSAEPPKEDNPGVRKIEEYTNTKLKINWIPGPSYLDKMNATIAAQDLPKIMYVNAGSTQTHFVDAVRSGMFWEIGPFLKDYKNLGKLYPDWQKSSSIDGKVYGITKVFPEPRNGIYYRKDWVEALGMKEPKTLDELLNVIKAFSTGDPDKNGKNDTYAIAATADLTAFNEFVILYGGPNRWGIKDGKVIPAFLTDEYKQVLQLFRGFYKDKYINQDFAVVKQNQFDLINKGKAGMNFGAFDNIDKRFAELMQLNPKAELDIIPRIEGPAGIRTRPSGTFPPMFVFPVTSIKTEAELKQILTFMDKMYDKEIQDLFTWGIEGVHYKMENGKPVPTDAKRFANEIGSIDFIRYDDGSLATKGALLPIVERYTTAIKENARYAVENAVLTLISETAIEKGAELEKIVDDARTKFVMGEIDENAWKAEIEKWKNRGGNKIIEEYTKQYEELKKKK
jgi:putative aldouronate transport system substrate-binding protein